MTPTPLPKSFPNLARTLTQLHLQLNRHYGRILQAAIRQHWGYPASAVGRFDESMWVETIVLALVAMIDWEWAVVLLVVVAVCLRWYLAIFTSSSLRTYEDMSHFPWPKVQQQCREVLQYVKFKRMVDFGYELRSNTNLILLEEAHTEQTNPSNSRPIDQKEGELQRMLLAVHQKVQKICSLCQKIGMAVANNSPVEGSVPLKFKDIFEMNRSMSQAITCLSTIAPHFKEKLVNPCQFPAQLVYCNSIAKNKLVPQMLELQKMVGDMHAVMSQLCKNRELSEENTKILHFLQSQDNNQLEEIEQICSNFEYSIKPVAEESINQQSKLYESSPNSQNFLLEQRTSSEQPKIDTFVMNRRQFLRKLDTVLTIGMARRKQQQFQRQMREEQQAEKLQSSSQPTPADI